MDTKIGPGRINTPNQLRDLASLTRPIKRSLREQAGESGPTKNKIIGMGISAVNPIAGGAWSLGKSINNKIEKNDAHNMAEFKKAVQRGGSPAIPQTKKRIGFWGQIIVIGVSGIVDLAEFIIDFFVIGVIVNRIIDIVFAIILLIYMLLKGLTLKENFKAYGSLVGAFGVEMIPIVDVAPLFLLDAWYITSQIKAQDKARQDRINSEANAFIADERQKRQIERIEADQQAGRIAA